VNEVLCYLQNNYGNHPKNAIRRPTTLIGFYDDDKIASAKLTLFKFADSLSGKPDGMPRLIRRVANDSKRKQECDNLLNLFSCLDEAKVSQPTFAAVNLKRVPTVNPGEMDVFAIGTNISNMSLQIESLSSSQMEAVTKVKDDISTLHGKVESMVSIKNDACSLRAEVRAVPPGSECC